jgi:hypothetical protein
MNVGHGRRRPSPTIVREFPGFPNTHVVFTVVIGLMISAARARAQAATRDSFSQPKGQMVGFEGGVATVKERSTPVKCSSVAFPIYSLSHAGRDRSCLFVELARAALSDSSTARRGIGVVRWTEITNATVAHLRLSDSLGRVIRRFTTVEVTLERRPYAVSVNFTTDGHVESVRKTERVDPASRESRRP